MNFNIGDNVTRKSYNNDTLFKIIEIDGDIVVLKGVNIRLIADSSINDLVKVDDYKIDDNEFYNRFNPKLNRDEYFYLPGKILHIDSDKDYLERCLNFYKKINVKAIGVKLKEDLIEEKIIPLLNKYKPDILVITGHDAYYERMGTSSDVKNYKNTAYFIKSVKEVRKYFSHNNLIIIAGACQSNYEELIKAGANFASSPKRVNIHALDPAIIAASLAFSNKNEPINLINIIEKTKYGSQGIGGIITNGTMYVGYPR